MKSFLLFFITSFISFAQTNKNFVLKGKCPGLSNQYLYLNYDNKKEIKFLDKVKIQDTENAQIQFKSHLYLGRPVVFRITNNAFDVFHG
jgi:hypothetical protein